MQVERLLSLEPIWTDVEKAIFMDKYPKNFHKIASFLSNRSKKDCIKFDYDSKSTIEWKQLLKEFEGRCRRTNSNSAVGGLGGGGGAGLNGADGVIDGDGEISAASLASCNTSIWNYAIKASHMYPSMKEKKDALIEIPSNDQRFLSFTNQPPHIVKTLQMPPFLANHLHYADDNTKTATLAAAAGNATISQTNHIGHMMMEQQQPQQQSHSRRQSHQAH